jgi:ubiquinone biosynthesis protein
MEVQPQLILLQKTLLQIEGLGRQLYPELDLWQTAQPIMREWAAERLSGRALAAELRRQLPDLSEAIRSLPQILQTIVQQSSEGRFRLKVDQPGIDELRADLERSSRRSDATVVAAAGLLGGLVWLAIGSSPVPGALLVSASLVGAWLARRS